MKKKIIAFIALIIVGVAAVSAAVVYDNESKVTDSIRFTGNILELEVGESGWIDAYHLPSGGYYSKIVWNTDDPSVATVENGKVKGVSVGNTIVKAELNADGKTYHGEYRISVVSDKAESQKAYDVFSEDYDYAVLDGNGFKDGLLSLTFNCEDNIIISLSGYRSAWSVNTSGTGCASSDFDKIEMTVMNTVSGTKYVTHYENGKKEGSPENGSTNAASNEAGYTSLMALHGLEYGEYTVEFKLIKGAYTDTVNASFTYVHGNGNMDVSGTYNRNYVWKFDGDNDGIVETHSISAEFDYREYATSLMINTEKIKKDSNSMRNYKSYSECTSFHKLSSNILTLSGELMKAYTDAYGTEDYKTQQFAQFVLAFCQLNFDYEYDNTQYFRIGNAYQSGSDYWAFPEETLYSGYGDCEDLSLFSATLFSTLGFQTAGVIVPNHMVFALALDDFEPGTHQVVTVPAKAVRGDKTYYFCETTVKGPVRVATTTSSGTAYEWICSLKEYHSDTFSTKYRYFDFGIGNISSSINGQEFEIYYF